MTIIFPSPTPQAKVVGGGAMTKLRICVEVHTDHLPAAQQPQGIKVKVLSTPLTPIDGAPQFLDHQLTETPPGSKIWTNLAVDFPLTVKGRFVAWYIDSSLEAYYMETCIIAPIIGTVTDCP